MNNLNEYKDELIFALLNGDIDPPSESYAKVLEEYKACKSCKKLSLMKQLDYLLEKEPIEIKVNEVFIPDDYDT